jgi:4-hydroxybenzoate polyprenyltransferase
MIFGAMFVVVGLLGYVSNPLIGPDGLFMTNGAHNLTHLLIGVILLVASTQTERAAYLSNMTFGALYGLLALMGFASIGNEGHTNLLGMVHINGADNWLHVFLAVAMIGAAMAAHRGRTHVNVH